SDLEQGAIEQQSISIPVLGPIGTTPGLDLDVSNLCELTNAALDGLPSYPEPVGERWHARPAPAVLVGISAETGEQAIGGITEATILDSARRRNREASRGAGHAALASARRA